MQKKLIVIPIVLCLFVSMTSAQLIKSYGFKVAVTSAFQKFDYSPISIVSNSDFTWKRKTGLNAGFYVEWFKLPIISFLTQIEYRQVGVGNTYSATGSLGEDLGEMTEYGKVNYVSMPLLLKAKLPAMIISPYLLVGPRIDYLLTYSSDHDYFDPVYEEFKKTVYGGTLGIGIETKSILPITTLFELRYNFDTIDSYNSEYLIVRNNSYDFCVGIGF